MIPTSVIKMSKNFYCNHFEDYIQQLEIRLALVFLLGVGGSKIKI
jgi:hypothetical protein